MNKVGHTLTERGLDGRGVVPSLTEIARRGAPEREISLPWLLPGLALLAGVAVLAAVLVDRAGDWLVVLTVGAVGALGVVGIVWTRSGAATTGQSSHAEAGWAALHAEVARSRRHNRPFVLVGIPDDVWSPVGVDQPERAVVGDIAALSLHTLLRTPDRAWAHGSVLHVLLTDCDAAQAEAFLHRARTSMPNLFPEDRVRLAAFPDDGVTVGALLEAVRLGSPAGRAPGGQA